MAVRKSGIEKKTTKGPATVWSGEAGGKRCSRRCRSKWWWSVVVSSPSYSGWLFRWCRSFSYYYYWSRSDRQVNPQTKEYITGWLWWHWGLSVHQLEWGAQWEIIILGSRTAGGVSGRVRHWFGHWSIRWVFSSYQVSGCGCVGSFYYII